MKQLQQLVRPNIWNLAPYSSARNEYSGHDAHVFLDANENPFNQPYNRYPDPLQREVKAAVSQVKGIPVENIFLGNGSDEAIDLVYRVFCQPGEDNVVAMEPTYGMYRVCADINQVEYRTVLLDNHFQITAEKLLAACDEHTKAIWICSPNNPTGNNINRDEVSRLIDTFQGIVVVDEAYADFSAQKPFRSELLQHPNLIVLNTMSKAWGSAAIRLGMAFASRDIIDLFNKVKYPYNVNFLTQQQALTMLRRPYDVARWVSVILEERAHLMAAFRMLPFCEEVFPTDANFFLARFHDAQRLYEWLVQHGIIVRNRTRVVLCNDCLRVTVGSVDENTRLLSTLRSYEE